MFVSLIKLLIVIFTLAFFFYCANLAFQGDLEMATILKDFYSVVTYCKEFISKYL
jgi:hypothetical protein